MTNDVHLKLHLTKRQAVEIRRVALYMLAGKRSRFAALMPPLRGRPPNAEECVRLDGLMRLRDAITDRIVTINRRRTAKSRKEKRS
jgi:hypothetical protein